MTRDWKQPFSASSSSVSRDTNSSSCCTFIDEENSPLLLTPGRNKKPSATPTASSSTFALFSGHHKPKRAESKSNKSTKKSSRIGKMFALTGMAYCLLSVTMTSPTADCASLPEDALQQKPSSPESLVVIAESPAGSVVSKNAVIPIELNSASGDSDNKLPVVEVIASTTEVPTTDGMTTTSAPLPTTTATVVPPTTLFAASLEIDAAHHDDDGLNVEVITNTEATNSSKNEEEEQFLGEYVTEITIRDAACGQEPPEFLVRKGERKNISFWIPADPIAVEWLRTSTLPSTTTTDLPTTTEPQITATAATKDVENIVNADEDNVANDDASQSDNLVEITGPASITDEAETTVAAASSTTAKTERLTTMPSQQVLETDRIAGQKSPVQEATTLQQMSVPEDNPPVTFSSAVFQDEPDADEAVGSPDALEILTNANTADDEPAHQETTTVQPASGLATIVLLGDQASQAFDEPLIAENKLEKFELSDTETTSKGTDEEQSTTNAPITSPVTQAETEISIVSTESSAVKVEKAAEELLNDKPVEVEAEEVTRVTTTIRNIFETPATTTSLPPTTEPNSTEDIDKATTLNIQRQDNGDGDEEGIFMSRLPTKKTIQLDESTRVDEDETKTKSSPGNKKDQKMKDSSSLPQLPEIPSTTISSKNNGTQQETESAKAPTGEQQFAEKEDHIEPTIDEQRTTTEVPSRVLASTTVKTGEHPAAADGTVLITQATATTEEPSTDKAVATEEPATDVPQSTTQSQENAITQKEVVTSQQSAAVKPASSEQEFKRSQPDETLEGDSSIRNDAPKEDEVLAAIYGLLGGNDQGLAAGSPSAKAAVRKRKANELDLITDATDARPDDVDVTTVPSVEQHVEKSQRKPGANYRTVDTIYAAHDRGTPIENQVRGSGENEQKPKQGGSSIWNFFRNAYNNGAGGLWGDGNKKKESNGKKQETEISRPDPFQVIPAPQLGNMKPGENSNYAGEGISNKRKRIKTEEITDGGITHVIIGSYSLDESEPEEAAETIVGTHLGVSKPEQSKEVGGQALSVSYKLSVEPGTRVQQVDGVIAGFGDPHPVAGSLYPGSGFAQNAQDRADSSAPTDEGSIDDTGFHHPRITYDWTPSNGPGKPRPFDDENLFVGTVEDVRISQDSYEHFKPPQSKKRIPVHAISSDAELPSVSYDTGKTSKPTAAHAGRKEHTKNKHTQQQVFLPGDFVKAKFQPEDISALVTSKKPFEAVAAAIPKMENLLPPDEKIRIPIVIDSEGTSSGQGGDDTKAAENMQLKTDEKKSVVVEGLFEVQKVRNTAEPFKKKETIHGTQELPSLPPSLPVTSKQHTTTAKPNSEESSSFKPSKPIPYPLLKKPEGPSIDNSQPDDSKNAEKPRPKIPAPVLPPSLPPAKAPPGNGIENVVQGMKNFQYPSVVIISGKSKTRQQLREEEEDVDPTEAVRRKDERFYRFLETQPFEMQEAFLRGSPVKSNIRVQRDVNPQFNNPELGAGDGVTCDWRIKAEDPSLFLLVTFRNLSAPFSVDCEGAYIEIERENNGYQARWCGTNSKVGDDADGVRQNIILTRSEVRLGVFDDEKGGKAVPTGFDAEVEVIDLRDSRNYEKFRKSSAYGQLRRLNPRLAKRR